MRIAEINRRIYPEVFGGTHKYASDVAQKLAQRGHSVHFIYCTFDKDNVQPFTREGIHFHPYYVPPSNPLIENYLYIIYTYQILEKLHKEEPFDIIHIHESRPPFKVFFSERFKDIPIIYNFQASTDFEYWFDTKKLLEDTPSALKRLLIKIKFPFFYQWHRFAAVAALNRVNEVIVLSDFVKWQIEKRYKKDYSNKVVKIPAGVDIARFTPSENKAIERAKYAIPEDQIVFFTLRRLAPRMGLFILIDAINILLKENPELGNKCFFIIGGKGELRPKLEERIKEHRLQNVVRLEGLISDEALPDYYRLSDCFIIPTEELEGFGIVTIEALASGIPVLATPAGATPEILLPLTDNEHKYVSQEVNGQSLAHLLGYFIKNKHLYEDAQKYRNYALEKYDWDKIISIIEGEFFKLVKR